MMIRPRPMPPYLPIYPESDRAAIQARYEQDVREWLHEADFMMWTNGAIVLGGAVGVIVAALMGPQIVLDAIQILAR